MKPKIQLSSHQYVLFLADRNDSELDHAIRAAAEGGGRVTTLAKENHGEISEHKDSSYDAVCAD